MIGRAWLDLEASPRRARKGAGEVLASLGSEETAVVVEGRRYRAIGAERKGRKGLIFPSRCTWCVSGNQVDTKNKTKEAFAALSITTILLGNTHLFCDSFEFFWGVDSLMPEVIFSVCTSGAL
jgi:hypothetical protein